MRLNGTEINAMFCTTSMVEKVTDLKLTTVKRRDLCERQSQMTKKVVSREQIARQSDTLSQWMD